MPASELLLREPPEPPPGPEIGGVAVPPWVLDTWRELLEYCQRRMAEEQAEAAVPGEAREDVPTR